MVCMSCSIVVAVNVKWFGALNNTDSTIAIRTACANYKDITGDAGDIYILSGPIILTDNTTFDMAGATLKLAAGLVHSDFSLNGISSNDVLVFSGTTGVTIQNTNFDGNSSSYQPVDINNPTEDEIAFNMLRGSTTANNFILDNLNFANTHGSCVYLNNCEDFLVSNIVSNVITGQNEHPGEVFYINGSSRGSFSNIVAKDTGDHVFYIQVTEGFNAVDSLKVSNINVDGSGQNALTAGAAIVIYGGATNITITDASLINCRNGIQINPKSYHTVAADTISISNIVIKDSVQNGISLLNDTIDNDLRTKNVSLSNIIIENAGQRSLQVDRFDNLSVTNCAFNGLAGTTEYAGSFLRCDNLKLSNVSADSHSTTCYTVSTSNNIIFSGLDITNHVGVTGVHMSACENIRIRDFSSYNNSFSEYGIYLNNCTRSYLSNIHIKGAGLNCVYIENSVHINLSDSILEAAVGHGVYSYYSDVVSLKDVKVKNNGGIGYYNNGGYDTKSVNVDGDFNTSGNANINYWAVLGSSYSINTDYDATYKANVAPIYYADTLPTNGLWKKGTIIYKLNPIAGGHVGWVNLRDGTNKLVSSSATADVVSGSTTVTNISSSTNMVRGNIINFNGVTNGPFIIMEGYNDGTIGELVLDIAPDATISTTGVNRITPIWKTFGTIEV
jgi:hypothetical protein